jgi:hypothetical protein
MPALPARRATTAAAERGGSTVRLISSASRLIATVLLKQRVAPMPAHFRRRRRLPLRLEVGLLDSADGGHGEARDQCYDPGTSLLDYCESLKRPKAQSGRAVLRRKARPCGLFSPGTQR